MNSETLQEIKWLHEARPFRPFKVLLVDGRELLVEQPEFVGWSTEAGTLVYANEHDAFDVFPIAHVTVVRPATIRRKRPRV